MCVNCMSNAEATGATLAFVGAMVKPYLHQRLARLDLAPDPDPVAHDVRTIAFLESLDLDPVEVLGQDVVDQASVWEPDSTWVPLRARIRSAFAARSARPIGSQSRLIVT